MSLTTNATLHDAYAADYDAQVCAYDCHMAEILFGLCYEFIQPRQSLLDVGLGSGLAAQPFAKAGLEVHGMDFSPAMLEICQAKEFAVDLKEHDLQQIPWPYQAYLFDHLVSCGVFHFVADLESIFGEANRVLQEGGLFAFTTKIPPDLEITQQEYDPQNSGGFEIFPHAPAYIETLLTQHAFTRLKTQKCFVGDELFILWVVQKTNQRKLA